MRCRHQQLHPWQAHKFLRCGKHCATCADCTQSANTKLSPSTALHSTARRARLTASRASGPDAFLSRAATAVPWPLPLLRCLLCRAAASASCSSSFLDLLLAPLGTAFFAAGTPFFWTCSHGVELSGMMASVLANQQVQSRPQKPIPLFKRRLYKAPDTSALQGEQLLPL